MYMLFLVLKKIKYICIYVCHEKRKTLMLTE